MAYNLSLTSLKFQALNTPLKIPSGRTCAMDFYVLKKIHRPQLGLSPRTLDLEVSTLPRDA